MISDHSIVCLHQIHITPGEIFDVTNLHCSKGLKTRSCYEVNDLSNVVVSWVLDLIPIIY